MSSSDAVRRFRARCAIGSPNREAARIAASARASVSPLANGAFASSSNASLRSRASRSAARPRRPHRPRARSGTRVRELATSRELLRVDDDARGFCRGRASVRPVPTSRRTSRRRALSPPRVSRPPPGPRRRRPPDQRSCRRSSHRAATRTRKGPARGSRRAPESRDRRGIASFEKTRRSRFPRRRRRAGGAAGRGRLVLRGGGRSPSLSSSSSCIPLARGGERSSPSSSLSCLPLARGGERSSPSSSLSCLRLALGGERSAPSPSPTWLRNAPFFIATSSSSSLSCLPARGGERSSSAASHISTFLGSSATAHPLPSSLMPRYGRVLVTLSPSTTFASTTTGPSSGFAVAGSSARFQSSTSSSRMRTPAPTCFTLTSPSVLSFFFRRFFFRASSSGAGSPPPPDTYRFR